MYDAPELRESGTLTPAADIWSLGTLREYHSAAASSIRPVCVCVCGG